MEGLMGGEGREEQLLVGNGRGMKVVVEKEREERCFQRVVTLQL